MNIDNNEFTFIEKAMIMSIASKMGTIPTNQAIKEKLAAKIFNIIDKILSLISSSYRERKVEMRNKIIIQPPSNSVPEEIGKKILFRKPVNQQAQLADKLQGLEQANIDKTELNKSSNNSILVQDVSTQSLSLETLNQELRDWENDPEAKGNKQEAIQRIRQSFESREVLLDLDGLELNSLPTIIGQFNWIQELMIEKNQLKILPTVIFQLTQLKGLYISDNQLEILSSEIGQLTRLKWLDMVNNKLQSLPNEISNLVKLKRLNIKDNPNLQEIPVFSKNARLKIFR